MKNIGWMVGLAIIVLSAAIAVAELNSLAYPFTVSGASTQTVTKTSVVGKPVHVSALLPTNMTLTVATVSGYGGSLGGARTIMTSTNVTSTNKTISTAYYLFNDRLAVTIGTADTNATGSATVRVILLEE